MAYRAPILRELSLKDTSSSYFKIFASLSNNGSLPYQVRGRQNDGEIKFVPGYGELLEAKVLPLQGKITKSIGFYRHVTPTG